jgi:hypothetical protein
VKALPDLVASNPACPASLLASLVHHHLENRWVQIAAAEHPGASPKILAMLARHADPAIRAAVARNVACPPELFALFARDREFDVVAEAAANVSSPPEVVAKLAHAGLDSEMASSTSLGVHRPRPWNNEAKLRGAAASNPSCPIEAIVDLLDDIPEVRRAVAANHGLPEALMWRVANDSAEGVVVAFLSNPASPAHLVASVAQCQGSYPIRVGLAGNPNSPRGALLTLAEDDDFIIRTAVARNPSTPPIVLRRLSGDADPTVKRAALKHPCLGRGAMVRFERSSDPRVRMAVATNTACSGQALSRLGEDPDPQVRQAVADNPSSPHDALARCVEDSDLYVRARAAGNTACSTGVLSRLALDSKSVVRVAVALNPSCPGVNIGRKQQRAAPENIGRKQQRPTIPDPAR